MDDLTHPSEWPILVWAAGITPDLPECSAIDEQRLFALLEEHNLVHRFLIRFLDERTDWCSKLFHGRPNWCSEQLLDQLIRWRSAERRKQRLQLDALAEIADALAPTGHPLAVVKGLAAHRITGEDRHIRFSHDIDVLFPDIDRLHDVLMGLGFHGKRNDLWHEFKMERGDVRIELHRYFPVWSYPAGIWDIDLTPERHAGYWNQNLGRVVETKALYKDIASTGVSSAVAGFQNVVATDLAMTIFLRSAHAFKDYVHPSFWYVPLADVAEMHDLATRSDFDSAALSGIVEQFKGVDCVQFMGTLLQTFYGTNPLGEVARARLGEISRFPVLLLTHGCWAVLDRSSTALSRFRPGVVGEMMGANLVEAASDELPKSYEVRASPQPSASKVEGSAESSHAPLVIHLFDRVVIQSADGHAIPMTLSVRRARQGLLKFDIEVSQPFDAGYGCLVGLYFEPLYHVVAHWAFMSHNGCLDLSSADQVTASIDGGLLKVSIYFPWPDNLARTVDAPVMLYVKRTDGPDLAGPRGTVQLTPLNVAIPQPLESCGRYWTKPATKNGSRATLSDFIDHNGVWYLKAMAFYSKFIKPGNLCFDIGANMGSRTRAFRYLGARVIAVEPQNQCIGALVSAFEADEFVTVVQAAAGEMEGAATMKIASRHYLSSLCDEWVASVGIENVTWDRKQDVQVTTLDHLIDRYGVPSFIKIDVEGYDSKVLAGLSRAIDLLSFEFHSTVVHMAIECIASIERLGNYEMNLLLEENLEFELNEWVEPTHMADILAAYGHCGTYGDVFARMVGDT